jgi:microtubule-associated protein-like 6
MGLTASTGYGTTGARDHFVDIVQPNQKGSSSSSSNKDKNGDNNTNDNKNDMQGRKSLIVKNENTSPSTSNSSSSMKASTNMVMLDSRALIIKNLDCEKLWNNFIENSSILSFALSHSDTISLMKESLNDNNIFDNSQNKEKMVQEAIDNYLQLVNDLDSHTATSKILDFMSILTSVLLLAPNTISYKIDKLYEWITLVDGEDGFNFSQFFVALSSFEKGISHAMGHQPFAEDTIKSLTKDWIALADPSHNGNSDKDLHITKEAFSDFCSNRNIVVRKLLEGLSKSTTTMNSTNNIHEAVIEAVEAKALLSGPKGGDQWMANPAWKSTANKMLPKNVQHIAEKPITTLKLDWVHGYRGYDCRNNIHYLNGKNGDDFFYHAAALGIAMDRDNTIHGQSTKQVFFGEHTDDIISVATFIQSEGDTTLIATGEVGKNPAIHLYQWNALAKHFDSLCTMKGFHESGVVQMTFSNTGKCIFTIGANYTVALYSTDVNDQNKFGRMITSAKGPKGKVLDCCSLLPYNEIEGDFVSCGEKHIVYWTNNERSRKLEMNDVKLGSFKRDYIMCASRLMGAKTLVAGTSEGDLLYVQSGVLVGSNLICGEKSQEKKSLHSKAINSIYTIEVNDHLFVVTGGSDGKVCLLRQVPLEAIAADRKIELDLIGVFYVELTAVLTNAERLYTPGQYHASNTEDIDNMRKIYPPVRSVCLSKDLKKVLVGTQSCHILEYTRKDNMNFIDENESKNTKLWGHSLKGKWESSKDKRSNSKQKHHKVSKIDKVLVLDKSHEPYQNTCEVKVLMMGHYTGELWGLAIRPQSIAIENIIPSSPRAETERAEYATVGDDGILRIWDLYTRQQRVALDLKISSRCCAYSPDGQYLAVGLGGSRADRKDKHNGGVRIFRADDLESVVELKEAKQWISCLKFSPDGCTLAVGSRDNSIYLYSVAQRFKRKAKFCKHAAGITALDFSLDSKYMQSTCTAYELLFSDVSSGAQVVRGESQFGLEHWNTWTCPLGWTVLGIWDSSMDGSDINSVDRNERIMHGSLPKKEVILASGDDFGKVRVFKYPATIEKGSPCHEYSGHSSHVTNIRFMACGRDTSNWYGGKITRVRSNNTYDLYYDDGEKEQSIPAHYLRLKSGESTESYQKGDEIEANKVDAGYLLSTGGSDKCIFQWRCVQGVQVGEAEIHVEGETDHNLLKAGTIASSSTSIEDNLLTSGPSGGDEFAAVKPWLGAIKAPTPWVGEVNIASKVDPFYASLGSFVTKHGTLRDNINSDTDLIQELDKYEKVSSAAHTVYESMRKSSVVDGTQPDSDELELEWVHGYRGFDRRNNLFYLKSSQPNERIILYYAAALGIKLTVDLLTGEKKQTYFRGHDDDVSAMCILDPENADEVIVASGQMGQGKTYIWDARTLKTLFNFKTKQKTITQLAFSRHDSKGRFLISIGADSSIAISDWRSQQVKVFLPADAANTFHIVTPTSLIDPKSFHFLSVGDKCIKYWSLTALNLASTKVSPGKLNKKISTRKHLSCAEMGNYYYSGCEDGNIYYFTEEGATYQKLIGSFPATPTKRAKNHVLSLCVVPSQNLLITGCKDGSINIINVSSTSEKNGAIKEEYVLSFNITTLKSSHQSVQIGNTISVKHIHAIDISITSNPNIFTLLVGTRGCDMMEVSVDLSKSEVFLWSPVTSVESTTRVTPSIDTGILTRGHSYNELWGLATHPLLPIYSTVGDDMTLRMFSVSERKMLSVIPLGAVARACAYSSHGEMLAIGFGGRLGRGDEPKGGMVRIYRGNFTGFENIGEILDNFKNDDDFEFAKLAEARDAKQWISDVKWSPDNLTLVVGAHDSKVYIYDVIYSLSDGKLAQGRLPMVEQASLHLRHTFSKHSSVINHFDISSDGRYLQSNCAAYDLLFCDLKDGKQITSATDMKDVDWHTWTCTLGWPVQGIWQSSMDGSDINAVSRSSSGHLVVTSDDFGKIHLFRYPCIKENSADISYGGHSSHVMNVRWTVGDECVISCGGNDKTIMQWKHVITSPDRGVTNSQTDSTDLIELEMNEDDQSGLNGLLDGPGAGDEAGAGAVKRWLGAIRTPKNPPVINHNEPAIETKLEWIHGYTSGMVCNVHQGSNLYYAADGQIVYPAASLGIRLVRTNSGNSADWDQEFFDGHDDDILCLCISNDRRFVATGQTASGKRNACVTICVWDALDCRKLCQIDQAHDEGVVTLAFNVDGTQLLSVGHDTKFTHKIWDDIGGNWCRVQHSATATSGQSEVVFSLWLHQAHGSGCQLITGGERSINFWQMEGATLVKRQGRFGKEPQKAAYCAANFNSKDDKSGNSSWQVVVGTDSGDLYLFSNREVSGTVTKAHTGTVQTLKTGENSRGLTFLVSGGKDGIVRTWNEALQKVAQFDISTYSQNPRAASIISVDVWTDIDSTKFAKNGEHVDTGGLHVLVGTQGGDILELVGPSSNTSEKSGEAIETSLQISEAKVEPLICSHFNGELWGLATHPENPNLYATVGDDATLRIWSVSLNRCLKTETLGYKARSVTWAHVPVLEHEDMYSEEAIYKEIIAIGLDDAPDRNKRPRRGKKQKRKRNSPKKAWTEDRSSEESPLTFRQKGAVLIYAVAVDGENVALQLLAHGCNSDAWINDIKISTGPNVQAWNGEVYEHDYVRGTRPRIGIGSHDKTFYVFNLPCLMQGLDGTSAPDSPQKTTHKSNSNKDTTNIITQGIMSEEELKTKVLLSGTETTISGKYTWADCLAPLHAVQFTKHSSAVLHFDFNRDGTYFQSNCQAGELLFGHLQQDSTTGEIEPVNRKKFNSGVKQEVNSTKMAVFNDIWEFGTDVNHWNSQTCVLGWPVQGIWPPGKSLSHINTADRDYIQSLIVTGDDDGFVKVFRYPSTSDRDKYTKLSGHASHVTCVRFTSGGNNIISTGGNDQCTFVWSYEKR